MIQQNITESLKDNYMPYTAHVIMHRALPEIDGLKPSQRRILYTMFKMGLLKSGRKKSQGIVGQTMFLHPHGDCLKGDTKIFTADGQFKTIGQIYKEGKNVDVIVVDKAGNPRIENAHSFRIGQYTNEVYRIHLSNGQIIETTSNHQFLIDNNKWIQAKDLKENSFLYSGVLKFKMGERPLLKIPNSQFCNQYELLQKFAGFSIYGEIKPNQVFHHKNENVNDNSQNNIELLSRQEHALLHKDYLIGLESGRNKMFTDDATELREKIRVKNSYLMSRYNKNQGLLKAFRVLDKLVESDRELTVKNYNEERKKYYNYPKLDRMIEKGQISNFKGLLDVYEQKDLYKIIFDKESVYNGLNNEIKQEDNKKRVGNDFINGHVFSLSYKVFKYMVETGIQISRDNYEETRDYMCQTIGIGKNNIDKRAYPKIETLEKYVKFKEIYEKFCREMPFILNVEIVSVDSEPMYDFTVDTYENMMIPYEIEEGIYSMVTVHNSAIYETLVRMAKDNEALLLPYIDSKGNFGKQYSRDMKYASARYTESKLSNIAKELFQDIDKNTVDMIDNYDGTLKEPRLLPVTFPSILVNTSSGTAVGMASSIAPFNITEVIDYTVAYIKNQDAMVNEYIKSPDLPTGGSIIYNEKDLKQIYETGKGSFKIRSTYSMKGNSIIFEEIPYTTTFEAIIEKITALVREGKIKDIVDIDDIYGINTKGIEITVKNSTNKQILVERLFKMTPLEDSFSCNFNLIANGKPQTLGIRQIIHEWVLFRSNAIKRGARFDISKKEQKKHLLLALKLVLLDIDKAVAIIRKTKSNSQVVANLMKAFQIDEQQAEYVAEIKLRHLNEEYLLNRIEEIETLAKDVAELDEIIHNKSKLDKLMIKQLEHVKKMYGQERKSQIIYSNELPTIDEEEFLVENYNVRVVVTKEGYLKKIPLTSLRGGNVIKVKDGDVIVNEYNTTNNSDILVFTNKQNCYKYKTYELEDHKPSVLGEYLPTLLELNDEEILFVTATNNYKGNLLIGFEDGKVAKIELTAYKTKQNRSMLKNAYANKKAIYWNLIHEDLDILGVSSIKKAIIFNTVMINPKSTKNTIGVQAMKSKKNSVVIRYYALNDREYDEKAYYFTQGAGIGKYLRDNDFSSKLDQENLF